MLLKVLGFEWRYFTRQPSFIVTSMVFFTMPFLAMSIENIQIGDTGNLNYNSPHTIANFILILGVFSMFLCVNFVANSAIRNEQTKMLEIIASKPMPLFSYRLGRFFGAYLVSLTVFSLVPLGSYIGSLMPWIDSQRMGDNKLIAYIVPFLVFSVVTLFTLSAIFYSLAIRLKSIMAVYLAALALFITYALSGALFDNPQHRGLLALTDPFGLRAFSEVVRYWTPSQRNSDIVGLSDLVLYNRLIWLIVGCFFLFGLAKLNTPISLIRKSFSFVSPKMPQLPKKVERFDQVTKLALNISYKYSESPAIKQFGHRLRFEIKQIMLSPAFLVLMLFCSFSLVTRFIDPSGAYGTPDWPLTQAMTGLIAQSFSAVIIIIITYYSGEVIWKERTAGIGDMIDSMPVNNLVLWLAKFIAVCSVIASVFMVGMICTIFNQLVVGYTNIDILQYIISIFYFYTADAILLIAMSFFIQTLSPNKYVGMLIFVGFTFASVTFFGLGLEHGMFNYSSTPTMVYSDMNGYAWFITTQNWYLLYWGSFAAVMCIFSYGMLQRGNLNSLSSRFTLLGYQLGVLGKKMIAVFALIFVMAGIVIHYNTRVLNDFVSTNDVLDLQHVYELKYKKIEDSPLPSMTKLDVELAIFPEQRRIESISTFTIQNKTKVPIKRFLVNLPEFTPVANLYINGGSLLIDDPELRTAFFEFDTALQVGEEKEGRIEVVREHHGFKDQNEDFSLVKNGTFVSNYALFPTFGVNKDMFIADQHERRKKDLPPPQRAHLLEDSSRYTESIFGRNETWIDFSILISTSEDQTAIAPGYLKAQWVENKRAFFRYEMDAPILNFLSILSAKLEHKTVIHNDIELSVFYHHEHAWNIDVMLESMKDSLDYFEAAFGPYQYRQLRVIEFPGYRNFAQSFANTIPYSEKLGFISNLSDSSNIDPVYYVTSHEVAHQWFGHQLIPANVQGANVLSESLSQYAALMVMKNKFGETKLRHFLNYELDTYLRGRTTEYLEEMPMLKSEAQQYIHYSKGSLVMNAIRAKIGEDNVNQALRALIEDYGPNSEVFATTLNLVASLKRFADEQYHDFIDQQFSQITLYDLRVSGVSIVESSTENSLDVVIQASQYLADGRGIETEQPFKAKVDLVVFDGNPAQFAQPPKILHRVEVALSSGENNISLPYIEGAEFVAVDPFVKFIDRDSQNNIRKIR
jgi:ABC-2 type transport system permease protein